MVKRTLLGLLTLLLVAGQATSQTARLQVIHNAADPAADSVDVYVNGSRLLDNFAFRSATPFINVPAGVQVNIGIAAKTSSSVNDTLKNFRVVFSPGRKYVAVANGVVNPSGFAPNPDGRSIALNIFPRDGMRERALSGYLVDISVFHGSTDAPTVDVLVRGLGGLPLVNNLSYGSFSGYRSVLPRVYTLDVTPGNDNRSVVASFRADLSGLRGGAAVVFASGFLNPSQNQNGSAFGLFAALPTGTVVELPKIGTARLQVIHNAADPGADSVDVYVNGARLLNDFAFRKATPFIDVPAGVPVNIGVAGSNSASANDTLKNFVFTFGAGRTYVAIANGVLSTAGFAPNPNGRNIAFTIFAKDGFRERSPFGSIVALNVFHGSTDAPTVDVRVRGFNLFPLVNDLTYGEFSGYRYVLPRSYTLDITPGNSRAVVASFVANLGGLRGKSAVVFASGFLNPGANQNGPAFGLFAALPTGDVVALPAAPPASTPSANMTGEDLFGTASETPNVFSLSQNFPNPFNPSTTIAYSLPGSELVSLKVYNLLGQEVAALVNEVKEAGNYTVTFDATGLASGTYIYRLQAGSLVETKRLTLLK